uniref:Thymidylate kinase-like domain-containing protein n=1 Tax=Chenopodium quinoa TaxID=63459 RepID=A0A803MR14_CHEQI
MENDSSKKIELLSHLQSIGCSAELWRLPDQNTAVGQMISAYLSNQSNLDDHTIHLLFSANRWEKRSMMEEKLKSGTTLIIDRYSYSGVDFSSSKGLDFDWCKAPEIGLMAPDMVLYLDISPEMVDACLPMEEVQKKFREYVLECVAACKNGRALSHFWSQ